MSLIHNPPDYRSYQGFRAGAQYAKPVARMLRNAAPPDIAVEEKKALRVIESLAEQVQDVLTERDRFSGARVRPYRTAFINYWSALHDVLVGKARLGSEFGDQGERAQALLDTYFPEGVSFTLLDAYAAWFEAQRRLDRISDENQLQELEQIATAPMVQAIKKGTTELGEAIGVGKTARHEVPSATAVQETMAKFSRAVGAYARLLAAKVDEENPASIERFRRAVAPIDEYRSMRGRGGSDEPEPVEPDPTEPQPTEPAIEPAPQPAAE